MHRATDELQSADLAVATTLRSIAIIAGFALIVWLLSDIVLLIFLAALIAVMLRGVSDWAARRTGAAQMAMLAVVSISVTAILLGLVYYIGPKSLTRKCLLRLETV